MPFAEPKSYVCARCKRDLGPRIGIGKLPDKVYVLVCMWKTNNEIHHLCLSCMCAVRDTITKDMAGPVYDTEAAE